MGIVSEGGERRWSQQNKQHPVLRVCRSPQNVCPIVFAFLKLKHLHGKQREHFICMYIIQQSLNHFIMVTEGKA